MGIATNSKGKATTQSRMILGRRIRVLERTARENGLLRLIKGDRAEFFPVADE